MIFRKDKNEDYLGVARRRLFDEGAFSEGLKNLESAALESSITLTPDPETENPPVIDTQQQLDTLEQLEPHIEVEPSKPMTESTERSESRMADRLILSLEEQVAFLKQQLEVKDSQLHTKDELIRNFQVLIKQDQETILLLENKLSETRNFPKVETIQEDSSENEKENAPQQAEIRYNRESKQKTPGKKPLVDTKPVKAVPQGVVKAKRSFLSGWFGK